MTHELHSHCSYCGAKYGADAWPRECGSCGNMTWRNPTPVGVALLPVGNRLVGIRRGIEPKQGSLALPGGFIDYGESWQEGVCRELHEELGIVADPAAVALVAAHSPPSGRQVLLFGLLPAIRETDLPNFVPNREVTERVLLTGAEELAFPLHERVVREWFARRR